MLNQVSQFRICLLRALDGKMFLAEIHYPENNAYPKVTFSDIIKKDLGAVKKLLFTKSKDWEYEEEQRIILNDKNKSGTSLPRPLPLLTARLFQFRGIII